MLLSSSPEQMMQETSEPEPWSNTTALLATLKGINFTGVSGPVSFDKNGDRIPYVNLRFHFVFVLLFFYMFLYSYGFDLQTFQKGGEVAVTGAISNDGVVTLLSPIVWSDGTNNTPTDYLHSTYPPHFSSHPLSLPFCFKRLISS